MSPRRPAGRLARAAALAAAALVATGCGGGDGASRSAGASAAVAGAAGTPPGVPEPAIAPGARATMGPNGCLHDGRWRPCALADRLQRAGLVPTLEKDSARYEFLAVPGLRYTVGRGAIEAFFYDDTTRLARDVAALDTALVSPKGTTHAWDTKPTFVRSGNLIVLVMTLNEHLIERISLAVEGGAPQPEPDSTVAQPLPPTRVP